MKPIFLISALLFLGISTSSNTTTSGSCEFQEVLSESYSGFWKLYGIADAYPYPGTRFFGNNSYNSYAGVYIGGLCFGCAVDDSDSYAMVYCDRGMMHVQWKFSIHGRVSFWEDFGVLLGSGRFKRFFRISEHCCQYGPPSKGCVFYQKRVEMPPVF